MTIQTAKAALTTYDCCAIIEGFDGEPHTEDEVIEAFQHLINTGDVWSLQGFYGRTAHRLIELRSLDREGQVMASLSANGHELARYFDPRRCVLVSIRSNGKRLFRGLGTPGWRLLAKKRDDVTLDKWVATKLAHMNELPWWCSHVKSLPSLHQLNEWQADSVCETVTGDTVEPDGHGPDGAPSWLVALRMI